jgi:hypothetical protein
MMVSAARAMRNRSRQEQSDSRAFFRPSDERKESLFCCRRVVSKWRVGIRG